ncbi:hypothetical protein ACNFJN_15175 [Xenorhabdus budapestensis]|uniref:hypothetical protein n=1 Tax=Xenorhabdus budapestensis TaxID=290110 RepID=UPI003A842F71
MNFLSITAKNAFENNFLSAKNVLDMHKELEEADKTGADKQALYDKYAAISEKNWQETVAGDWTNNPFSVALRSGR